MAAPKWERIRDTSKVDWDRGVYDQTGIRVRNDSDWNGMGDGRGMIPIFYKAEEPKKEAPKPEAPRGEAPRSAITPKEPEPAPETTPAPVVTTPDERAEVTQPAQGLESTIKTAPSNPVSPYEVADKTKVKVPTLQPQEQMQSFLTRKKKQAGSFLTRNV